MEQIRFLHPEYSVYLQYVLKRSAVLDRLEHGFSSASESGPGYDHSGYTFKETARKYIDLQTATETITAPLCSWYQVPL